MGYAQPGLFCYAWTERHNGARLRQLDFTASNGFCLVRRFLDLPVEGFLVPGLLPEAGS